MSDPERPLASHFPLTKNATTTPPPSRRQTVAPYRRPPHPLWTFCKWTLGILYCVGLLAAGTFAGNLYWSSSLVRSVVNNTLLHPVGFFRNPTDILNTFTPENYLPPEKQHVIHVLLLGCDVNYDERRPVILKDSRGRSDAIMLARIDFDRKTVNVLSIPRDTAVHIPGRRGIHKINAAHAFGGPELTQETIKSVFGLSSDYYVTINFQGLVKVVDAVGGVDLTVHKRLKYDDNWGNLHIDLYPGFQHLNGYQAMGYVRMRHSDSDLMRAQRQQEFLEALREKIKQPETLLKIQDVLKALTDSIHSNMSDEQMLTLANFVRQLPRENIHLETLPSFEGPSFVYVNEAESRKAIRRLFYDDFDVPVFLNTPGRGEVADARRSERRARRRSSSEPRASLRRRATENPEEFPPIIEDSGESSGETSPGPSRSSEDDTDTGSGTRRSDPAADGLYSEGA